MKQTFSLAGSTALLLLTVALSSNAADDRSDILGNATTSQAAMRVVTIGPDTGYVNVTRGDIVKFVVGDKAFSWSFDGASTISEIDLNNIAPPGILSHAVKVYIKRNAAYDGA